MGITIYSLRLVAECAEAFESKTQRGDVARGNSLHGSEFSGVSKCPGSFWILVLGKISNKFCSLNYI